MNRLWLYAVFLGITVRFSLSAERPSSTETLPLDLRTQCVQACRKGKLELVKKIVCRSEKNGFERVVFLNEDYSEPGDYYADQASGETPLIVACKSKGDHAALVAYLLDCGAKLHLAVRYQCLPFITACFETKKLPVNDLKKARLL